MTAHLVTRIYSTDEYADRPSLFAIELTDNLIARLKERIALAQQIATDNSSFARLVFNDAGDWADEEAENLYLTNSESLADYVYSNDYAVVTNFPDTVREMEGVRGHEVAIYPDGKICYRSYHKWSGAEFETPTLDLETVLAVRKLSLAQ
jgi:hypothetical protein